MHHNVIRVTIHRATKPGFLKAHADVRISIVEGDLILYGFSVIEQPGKPPWVGFPQKAGKIAGRYFQVTDAEGQLREDIALAILTAYETKS